MKNKKLMIVLSVVAGVIMLSATAFATISGSTGYDVYKAAVKNTIAAKSATASVNATVKDNGQQLMSLAYNVKINRDKNTMSSSQALTVGSDKKTIETYRQDGKNITKSSDSDVYEVFQPNNQQKDKKFEKHNRDLTKNQDVENVIDALSGNIQNYITLSDNQDGTKQVSMQVSGNQVSPVVNAVTSLLVKNLGNENNNEWQNKGRDELFNENLKSKLPQLASDIKVDNIDVKATINKDNLIQSQSIAVNISGKDADGKAHQVTVNIDVNISNVNSTTPDTVNLNGKQTKVTERNAMGRGHRGEWKSEQ